MKKRHKLMTALSVAAVVAVLFAAIALAAGRMTRPRPDTVAARGGEPGSIPANEQQDGEGAPNATPEATPDDEHGAERLFATLDPVITPTIPVMVPPTPEPTEGPTPMPTPEPMEGPTPTPNSPPTPWEASTPEPTPMPTPNPTPTPWETSTPMSTPNSTPTPAPEEQYAIVYALQYGNFYHGDPHCSGMENAVAWTEASAVLTGKQPCPVCLGDGAGAVNSAIQPEEMEETTVYYTDEGTYYHSNAQCSDLLGARRHTLDEAEADGKQRCPDCQPVEPDHYDLFLAAFGRGLDALYPGYAYSYAGVTDFFVDRSAWYVSDGESTLEACLVTNGLAEGDGVGILETEGGVYKNVMGFTLNADEFNDLWAFLADAPQPLRSLMTDESAEDAAWAAVNSGDDAFGGTLELKNVWAAVKPDGTVEACAMTFVDASRAEGPTLEVRVSWDRQEGGEYAMHTRTTVLPAETNGDIVIFPSYPAPASSTAP